MPRHFSIGTALSTALALSFQLALSPKKAIAWHQMLIWVGPRSFTFESKAGPSHLPTFNQVLSPELKVFSGRSPATRLPCTDPAMAPWQGSLSDREATVPLRLDVGLGFYAFQITLPRPESIHKGPAKGVPCETRPISLYLWDSNGGGAVGNCDNEGPFS